MAPSAKPGKPGKPGKPATAGKPSKPATSAKPARPAAIAVPYSTLRALLGKPIDDPSVTAALEHAGKVQIKSDFVIAKEAGFDFSLDRPDGAKRNAKKALSSLFLFSDGKDGHRGFADLPTGFGFVDRNELLAKLPAPIRTWKIGKGKVPVGTKDVDHDLWELDGVEISAQYRQGVASYLVISVAEGATASRELSTRPLHFETKPADAPPEAELVGMALLVAWAADRFGLPAKHASTELGKQLVARAVTPRAFLIAACHRTLTTLDVDPKLGDFLYGYTRRLFLGDDDDARAATDTRIAELLQLNREDERAYTDDFLGTFASAVDDPFHVPDSWDAVERISPVLDARWADYQATSFEQPPQLAIYEQAATLRDARSVVPDRGAPPALTVDAMLATELVALIGRPLTDKDVKAVLGRASLPVGTKIDHQANPALGVAYLGTKFPIAGQQTLGVDEVCFYAAKQTSYIRGLGAEVEFAGYPGALPHALALGETRAAVAKKLGSPEKTIDDYDHWAPVRAPVIACEFSGGKLVMVRFGRT